MNIELIKTDPVYGPILEKTSLDFVLGCGYFEYTSGKNTDIDNSINTLCTPFNFLKFNHIEGAKNCVLLGTGSYNPPHYGHIGILENAKIILEDKGYNVCGAYLSPGHDEYINLKKGDYAINIHNRINLLHGHIDVKKVDWLNVDPWEALFNSEAINYTDVYVRLKKYLRTHYDENIEVFYVCGGDNANHAGSFILEGNCVVVTRKGSGDEKVTDTLKLISDYKLEDRVFIDYGSYDVSSTELLKDIPLKAIQKLNSKPDSKKLNVRFNDKYSVIEHMVFELLLKYGNFSFSEKTYVEKQTTKTEDFFQHNNVISLDPCIDSKYKFGISRLYDIGGITQLGYSSRPGYETFEDQIKKLDKDKEYYIFDDDTHTGKTLNYVKNFFELNEFKIKGNFMLTCSNSVDMEICDTRDFIIGAKDGGLVIDTNKNSDNTTDAIRLPYVYPYVCPKVRASIISPMEFSIAIWELNAKVFSNSDKKMCDYINYTVLGNIIGLDPDTTTMYDFCMYHVNMLKKINNG